MQEVVTASMHFSTCGHTGHRTNIKVVELNRPFRKPLKVRRLHPIVSVRRNKVTTKSVVHHHYAAFFSQEASSKLRGFGNGFNARGYMLMKRSAKEFVP